MYHWLSDALDGAGTVVTANRRLTRVLQDRYVQQQLEARRLAWRSPNIFAWQDWLIEVLRSSPRQESLPIRLNQHQCHLLWERCLARELPESTPGMAALVRLSRDAWQRLADWQVSIRDVARSVQNDDQRLFAVVAGRYLGILERENWIDDAGLAQLVVDEISGGHLTVDAPVTFAGFDRERPIVVSLKAALEKRGSSVNVPPSPDSAERISLQKFETGEAEMRAAGAWARAQLLEDPGRSVAIVATDLEQRASIRTRLVREGLVPGWQYAPLDLGQAVNVSYGRKLADFPAVAVGLLLLGWLVRDLTSSDIGQLLRSPLLGSATLGGRSRLELRLRDMPDRRWSPSMLTGALRTYGDGVDASDWLELVARLSKLRRDIPAGQSPAAWAVFIDKTLKDLGWPGEGTLDSEDFQLVNRWRELLNDFARLDLVSPVMNFGAVVTRLAQMAAETVFQPQSRRQGVQLLGPLEASGAEFDAIWISGLTAAHWPPAGNPSPLLSRRLQREHRMPDATPADTVDYTNRILQRLGRSARVVVCSYPATVDDAEQTPSALLQSLAPDTQEVAPDPGYHAASLIHTHQTVKVADPVPALEDNERVAGGATTIQLQLGDPIAAFLTGRLGIGRLTPQAFGVPPPVRGNIIHDALYRLYADMPSRRAIAGWTDDELDSRISDALRLAMARHERHTDKVLQELFGLEGGRLEQLLRRFVQVDAAREDFEITAIEHEIAFASAGVAMQLRVDRIDRHDDGTLGIIDYKSGARKRFLKRDGEPREIQLVAYAKAIDAAISSLALANIDSREVVFDGVGRGYDNRENWHETLQAWVRVVEQACEELSLGDVRINGALGNAEARPLNLLTRYTELKRDS